MINIMADKKKVGKDNLQVLVLKNDDSKAEYIPESKVLIFEEYPIKKRNTKMGIFVFVEILLLVATILMVQWAYAQRGYLAFGGEWVPIIAFNIGVAISMVKWGDE